MRNRNSNVNELESVAGPAEQNNTDICPLGSLVVFTATVLCFTATNYMSEHRRTSHLINPQSIWIELIK